MKIHGVHIRPSNTEPIIRIFAEAPLQQDANTLVSIIKGVVVNILCFGKDGLLSTELQKWLIELNPNALVFLDKASATLRMNLKLQTHLMRMSQPS